MINVKEGRVKGWSTHNYMLIKCMLMSEGDVAEVGAGLYSTPLLHWMCKLQNRKLVTYEDVPAFYEMAKVFTSPLHKVRRIENWDDMDFKRHWGVVLIDHHPEPRRAVDALNFKDVADYIVIHDTEKADKYDLDRIWSEFKYVYHWKGCKPWTSVVSNLKDLSSIIE